MSRSCIRKASARPYRRSNASLLPITRGSPPGLALVITSTRSCALSSQPTPAGRFAASWKSRNCSGVYGSMTPSHASPGATPGNASSHWLRFLSRIAGRVGKVNNPGSPMPIWTNGAADGALATMTTKGFSSRCLRSRSRATATALRASHARWNPPSPLMATILPARSRSTAPATASSGSR